MGGCGDEFDFGAAWSAWGGPWGTKGGPKRKGGRRGRVFDRGDLKYAVLRLLARKPMHGYEVMQALEEESGGWYSPSAGSVYPVLQLLQDQGYVTATEEEGGKRVYAITDEGRAFLKENRDRADDVMDRVADIASRFTGEAMGEVTRSFVKLAQTSFEETVRRSSDPDALRRIREILERATKDMRGRSGNGAEGRD